MFSVSARTAHVYLVFEAFKVLQGDPEISIDPYSKISVRFFFQFLLIFLKYFLTKYWEK